MHPGIPGPWTGVDSRPKKKCEARREFIRYLDEGVGGGCRLLRCAAFEARPCLAFCSTSYDGRMHRVLLPLELTWNLGGEYVANPEDRVGLTQPLEDMV